MRPAAVALAVFLAACGAISEEDAPPGESLPNWAEHRGDDKWISGLQHQVTVTKPSSAARLERARNADLQRARS